MTLDFTRKYWLVALPLFGLLLLIITIAMKQGPIQHESIANTPLVKTTIAREQPVQPFVTGYGRAQPKESWQALSEVSGRIIYRHPQLEAGKVIPANTLLLKIDPTDYELQLAQAQSDLNSASAELERTQLNQEKAQLSLALEQRRLAVFKKELTRKQGLLASNVISQSDVDTEQSNVWAQEQTVLDLTNTIEQYPATFAVAKAQVKVAQARQAEAERKLAKTQIYQPFNGRISSVDAELHQVVNERDSLVTAHRTDVMEIPVQVAMSDMRQFAQHIDFKKTDQHGLPDVETLNLKADVTLYLGERRFHWTGRLTSIGDRIDPNANTVTLIVDVTIDESAFDPTRNPPLISDMYVQVTVKGAAKSLITVPSQAIRGNSIYILTQENTLDIRPVSLSFQNRQFTVIEQGVTPGDVVILNDIIPPVQGRKVRAQADDEATAP